MTPSVSVTVSRASSAQSCHVPRMSQLGRSKIDIRRSDARTGTPFGKVGKVLLDPDLDHGHHRGIENVRPRHREVTNAAAQLRIGQFVSRLGDLSPGVEP